MFFLVSLICTASSLLTFRKVDFSIGISSMPMLTLTLQDENLNDVIVQKNLLIQANPTQSFYTYPTTKFIGTLSISLGTSVTSTFHLTISCDGCEIYTTSIIINSYYESDFLEYEPSATTISANEEVSIYFIDTYGTLFEGLYMVTQENFDYSITKKTDSSGTAIVKFSSRGTKYLLFYFDDGTYTDIGTIKITVEVTSYSTITFTTNIVKFI
ncbi:hypothetical protein SteCoe_39371 [Stentor coeruleus]|uniref:Uncharacterized protein n=1 Tax=Stentor coeruleus TaxID=5963 RepID=A0A1R2AKN6_9CILI|nr:hypothetical protein SteCoe_39371 [Stentor coeruleus]